VALPDRLGERGLGPRSERVGRGVDYVGGHAGDALANKRELVGLVLVM
jgi:hypothetical protein